MRSILAIETSCDETSAAVVTEDFRLLSHFVRSQNAAHAPFRGVVPEIAAREHLSSLPRIVAGVLEEARRRPGDLSGVAATAGPGLVGALLVGLSFAKSFAYAARKPFLRVNHLVAHLHSIRLVDSSVEPPFLSLLVSGGHTEIVMVASWDDARVLGRTRDDAAGEAFDKAAKLLDLPFPGGPALDALADDARAPRLFDLPVPMAGTDGFDFSYSGLKTAVRYFIRDRGPLSKDDKANLAAAFRRTMVASLADRVGRALEAFPSRVFYLTGGVAANRTLREALSEVAASRGARFLAPPPELATDNAAMIGAAAWTRLGRGESDGLDAAAEAGWELPS